VIVGAHIGPRDIDRVQAFRFRIIVVVIVYNIKAFILRIPNMGSPVSFFERLMEQLRAQLQFLTGNLVVESGISLFWAGFFSWQHLSYP